MEDLKQIGDALIEVDEMYGILGVFGAILLALFIISLIVYHKAYLEKYAKSFFEQSLAKYKSELMEDIGAKLIAQNGDISKDISNLESKLSVKSNQETEFLSEYKNSMIEIYQAQTDWANIVLDCSAHMIDENNLELRFDYERKMDKARSLHSRKSAKFQIYNSDKKLGGVLADLLNKTMKLQVEKSNQISQAVKEFRKAKTITLFMKENPRGEDKFDEWKVIVDKAYEGIKTKEEELLKLYEEISSMQSQATQLIFNNIRQGFKS